MEEKVFEKLNELFPNFSFKLIREKVEGLSFDEKEIETLLVNETKIKVFWTPALSECSEEFFERLWDRLEPAVQEVTNEKKKTKSFKILDKLRTKYVSN